VTYVGEKETCSQVDARLVHGRVDSILEKCALSLFCVQWVLEQTHFVHKRPSIPVLVALGSVCSWNVLGCSFVHFWYVSSDWNYLFCVEWDVKVCLSLYLWVIVRCYYQHHITIVHLLDRLRSLSRKRKVIRLHQSQVELLVRKVKAKVEAKQVVSGRTRSDSCTSSWWLLPVTCCLYCVYIF